MLFALLLLVIIGYVLVITLQSETIISGKIGADGNKSKISGVDYVKMLSDRITSDINGLKFDGAKYDAVLSAVVEKFRELNAALGGTKKGEALVRALRSNQTGGGPVEAIEVDPKIVDSIIDGQENLVRIIYPEFK